MNGTLVQVQHRLATSCRPAHSHSMAVEYVDLPARGEYSVATFHGRDVRVAESTYPAGLFIAPHAHEGATLTAVLGGSLDENWGRSSQSCDRQTIVVRPAGAPHSDRMRAAGAINLEIDLHDCAAADAVIASRFATFRRTSDEHALLIARRISGELRSDDSLRALAIEGAALELVACVARLEMRKGASWLMRAYAMMRDRFDEPLTIADIAAAAGVHPVHLARAFRRRFGVSPSAMLRQIRLNRAAEELRHSEKPLSQIAIECGYYDHAHFTRAFRAFAGTTPSIFRAANRR